MSERERCAALLDSFTDAQLVNVSAMLQVMRQMVDDTLNNKEAKQMSERERAAALLGEIPQSKLGYAIGYFQGLLAAADAGNEESED